VIIALEKKKGRMNDLLLEKLKKKVAAALLLGLVAGGAQAVTSVSQAEAAKNEQLVFPTASVMIEKDEKVDEAEVRRLLPELRRSEIRVKKLSRQIQMVNDSKSMKLNADFRPKGDGTFDVVITAKHVQTDHITLGVNNTGNEYTGDWRASLAYTCADIDKNSGALGVSVVSSPGHWQDVKQAGLAYRAIFPKTSDSIYVTYTYSDVDMGKVGSFGGFDVEATGRGKAAGIHYQHNFKYSTRKKQLLDFGVDYKSYDNAHAYSANGLNVLSEGNDFDVTTLSATYAEINRWQNQFFAWNVGYTTNTDGDEKEYQKYRSRSDKHFNILKAGVGYQYRTHKDWLLNVHANGQYTNNNLIFTEQLGAGGIGSVRGFKQRAISADNGLITSLEIYTPKILEHSRFLAFCDMGRLYNNNHNRGELDNDTICSVGLGYRFYEEKSGLSVSLDYAAPIDGIKNSNGRNERRWNLMASIRF